jgi:hypothetical protein
MKPFSGVGTLGPPPLLAEKLREDDDLDPADDNVIASLVGKKSLPP